VVLINIVPREESLSISTVGSLPRLNALVVAGFWFKTILTEGRLRKFHLFNAIVLLFF
jgi:hypothetical protein